jgi:hypothetical protein
MDEFLARLGKLQPGLGGTARIEMTDIPRPEWAHCRTVLEAHGWAFDTIDIEQDARYWVVKRPGTAVVSRNDPYFINGPGLDELRRHPAARQAAEQAKREFGVDPLSDSALREVRARHLTLYRQATRRAGTGVVCGLVLLVVLIAAWRQLGDPVVLVPAVLLLVGTVAGSLLGRQALRERKAAVAPFTAAYERVVGAVLKRPDR